MKFRSYQIKLTKNYNNTTFIFDLIIKDLTHNLYHDHTITIYIQQNDLISYPTLISDLTNNSIDKTLYQ